MNKLLKDAIADAKAVRETALANAKVALEEAFAPKLQSMLSHKIKEEMEETEEEGMEVEKSEDEKQMEAMQKMAGITNDEDPDNEGMKNYMEEDEEDMPVDDMPPPSDEEEFSDEDESEEEELTDEEEFFDEEEFSDESEEEVSDEELEEILRELDNEPTEDGEETEGMNYEGDMSNDDDSEEMDEEINLEEIIAALREEDEVEASEEEAPEASEELEEAYGVIKYLRTKINEVNLLNAKLLYVNKLFRKGELTETQKVKIIETFDRAKNVREAKLIYATLSESVSTKKAKPTVAPKRKMNEGFASAPSKKTQIISESNGVYSRFKTLVEYNNKK